MAVTIAPVQQLASSAPVTTQLALQPGTVISAQVLQVLENGLAQIAIDSIAIAALSEVPLLVGDTLQLAVSLAADGIVKLSIVPQPAGNAASESPPAGATASGAVAPATGSASAVDATAVASSPAPAGSSPPIAPADPAAIAVAVATQIAAPRQQSLAPLFANLPVVVASDVVPQQVQAGASQLLALRPELNEQLSATDLRAAFEQSGLFLESSLAAGTAPSPSSDLKAALLTFRQTVSNWLSANPGEGAAVAPSTPGPAAATPVPLAPQPSSAASGEPSSAAAPVLALSASDAAQVSLPAAIAVTEANLVAEALSAVSVELPQPTASPQAPTPLPPNAAALSASGRSLAPINAAIAALEAAQQLLEGAPARSAPDNVVASVRALQAILSVAAAAKSPTDAAQATPGAPRVAAASTQQESGQTPPPFRGAAPSAQPIAAATLTPGAQPRDVAQRMLDQADGAIARQTLLQVASLPDRTDAAGVQFNANMSDTSPRWSFEIPFAMPQGTALAQFEIERDGASGSQVEQTGRIWRARFTLNIEPTGPIHALVSLIGDKTAVRMWAERPETAQQLRAQSEQLVQALRAAELEPGDIVVAVGAPPQPAAKAGRFLDRAS
jgi:hypothetical protein